MPSANLTHENVSCDCDNKNQSKIMMLQIAILLPLLFSHLHSLMLITHPISSPHLPHIFSSHLGGQRAQVKAFCSAKVDEFHFPILTVRLVKPFKTNSAKNTNRILWVNPSIFFYKVFEFKWINRRINQQPLNPSHFLQNPTKVEGLFAEPALFFPTKTKPSHPLSKSGRLHFYMNALIKKWFLKKTVVNR